MSGYRTQSPDTDPQVERRLIAAWRRLTPREKLERVDRLRVDLHALAEAGIRMTLPHLDDEGVRLELARRILGRELADKAYGGGADEGDHPGSPGHSRPVRHRVSPARGREDA